jgi:hypothetical protein
MEVAHSSHIILGPYISGGSRGNSVSIVSGYGLHDQGIEVRSPAEAKDFFSSLCPDRLWGPPSLLYNGYQGCLPWEKGAAWA